MGKKFTLPQGLLFLRLTKRNESLLSKAAQGEWTLQNNLRTEIEIILGEETQQTG